MARTSNSILRFMGLTVTGDFGPYTFYTSRRGNLVFFPKAPPLNPPSTAQKRQRQKYIDAAKSWKQLPIDERRRWQLAVDRASCRCTGYGLYVHWKSTGSNQVVRTIERQSGIPLIT